MTPRQAALTQGSPDLYSGSSGLMQQTSLPQVMKVNNQTNNGSSGAGGGLSVVSAPAPIAQRPELASATQINTRALLGQNITYDKYNNNKGVGGAKGGLRGGSNNLRMKQMELSGNHAIVYSWCIVEIRGCWNNEVSSKICPITSSSIYRLALKNKTNDVLPGNFFQKMAGFF